MKQAAIIVRVIGDALFVVSPNAPSWRTPSGRPVESASAASGTPARSGPQHRRHAASNDSESCRT